MRIIQNTILIFLVLSPQSIYADLYVRNYCPVDISIKLYDKNDVFIALDLPAIPTGQGRVDANDNATIRTDVDFDVYRVEATWEGRYSNNTDWNAYAGPEASSIWYKTGYDPSLTLVTNVNSANRLYLCEPCNVSGDGESSITRDASALFQSHSNPDYAIDKVDAALKTAGYIYIFKGDIYYKYRASSKRPMTLLSGYPRPIAGNWNLPEGWTSDLDAAFYYKNNKVYFFQGSEYLRYDITKKAVDSGYPRDLSQWPDNVFNRIVGDVQAAFNPGKGNIFLFFRQNVDTNPAFIGIQDIWVTYNFDKQKKGSYYPTNETNGLTPTFDNLFGWYNYPAAAFDCPDACGGHEKGYFFLAGNLSDGSNEYKRYYYAPFRCVGNK